MSASLRPWRGSLNSETWKQVPEAPGDRAHTPGSWACPRPFQFLSQPITPKAGEGTALSVPPRQGGERACGNLLRSRSCEAPWAISPLSGKLGLAVLSLRGESWPGCEGGGRGQGSRLGTARWKALF